MSVGQLVYLNKRRDQRDVVAHLFRKFLIDTTQKNGKQVRNAQVGEQRRKDGTHYFYNILNPSNKIQCDECKRDVTKCTKILGGDADYCLSCFSNLDQYPSEYHVINRLDFPLYDNDWTAEEELLLFEGLQKHGFGNWAEIADFIATNKTREDVEDHYLTTYLEAPSFLPNTTLLSRRDSQGRLVKTVKEGSSKKGSRPPGRSSNVSNFQSFQRGSLTLNANNIKTGSNPAQIVGYMPKRGDFQVQYDNDAELLLAEMEFNDDDSEQEKKMKFRLIDIYNQKLTQRIRRKEFVISRKLLDLKEQSRLDKTRTKEQKEVYNMMKVFARFSTAQEHEKLVQGILKEKQIRQRLEYLKDLKSKGFRTLSQAEQQIENGKRKEDRSRKKEEYNDKSKTRRLRKDLIIQKAQKRSAHMTKQEEDLCKRFNINYKQYMIIKETIIRESVKQGIIERDETAKIFRIDRTIVDGVFDFLVQKEEIIANKDTEDYQE